MMLGFELLRVRRSFRPHLAVLSLAFFLGLMLLGFYTYAKTQTGGAVDFRYTFENRSYFNGLTFGIYSFYFGFLLVLPIFAAAEGGAQIAGETSAGTLFLLLSRPISRVRLFLTKAAIAAGISAALTGVLLLLGLGLGLVAVGWGDLDLYPGVLQMTERHQHLEQGEALRRFAYVWPAASLALFVPLAMSLWIASWSRSPVNAVATSVALYFVLYVVAEVHFFQELRPWLFTSHMAYWRELFKETVDWAAVGGDALKLAGFAFLFLALGLRRFRLREEI